MSPARAARSKYVDLVAALELFLEAADPSEIERRLRSEVLVTRLRLGRLQILSGVLAEPESSEKRRICDACMLRTVSKGTRTS